ncbi:hypothetical protein FQZ97_947920 [compost metagenome]
MDGKDLEGRTEHLMAWKNGALLAYCRLLEPALNEGKAIIGRVITAPAGRGTVLGHELMRRAKAEVERLWPGEPVYLGAQARLRGYYAGHGFVPVTDEYMEDGIPHIGMLLDRRA